MRVQKPNRGKYQEELNAIAEVIEGTPQVKRYEVPNLTWYKLAAKSPRVGQSFISFDNALK